MRRPEAAPDWVGGKAHRLRSIAPFPDEGLRILEARQRPTERLFSRVVEPRSIGVQREGGLVLRHQGLLAIDLHQHAPLEDRPAVGVLPGHLEALEGFRLGDARVAPFLFPDPRAKGGDNSLLGTHEEPGKPA